MRRVGATKLHSRPAFFCLLVVVSVLSSASAFTTTLFAANAADWRAGNIIEDSLFYDNNSMSVQDIQAFLNSKNPNCDTWGTQPASEKGRSDITHAQYAALVGWHSPPYICLKDYHQVPRSDTIIDNYNSTATPPEGSISAAQIIKNAADSFGVSPKSLIVLLHKESPGPLTVDSWPLKGQYKNAMGYACPDTAPCDPQYAGFYNQMTNAAKRIKSYKDNPTWYRHQPFATNDTVYYNPNLNGCGWSSVYIESRATAGLYNYTPYQPNQAALDNLYGTGDDCSAYGNRNFWRIYTDWFGSTRASFVPLDQQRWLTLKNDTAKVNPQTGETMEAFPAGTDFHFVDKILLNGKWYLRTAYDSQHKLNKGIPQEATANIEPVPFDTPRYLQLSSERRKWDPVTGKIQSKPYYPAGLRVKFTSKVEVNNNWYYRTEFDHAANNPLYITATATKPITFDNFSESRYMQISQSTPFQDPATGIQEATSITTGTQLRFTSKVTLGGVVFFRTEDDTTSQLSRAVPASAVSEVPYQSLDGGSRWALVTHNTPRYRPATRTEQADSTIPSNSHVRFAEKIVINGEEFYRTEYDRDHHNDRAIPSNLVTDISYLPFENPRTLTNKHSVQKINPRTGQPSGDILAPGTSLAYATKILVNDNWYFRTQYDSNNDIDLAVPMDAF